MSATILLLLVNLVVRAIEVELVALDLAMPAMISLRRWARKKDWPVSVKRI